MVFRAQLFLAAVLLVVPFSVSIPFDPNFCENAYRQCHFRFNEDDDIFFPYQISNSVVDRPFTTNFISRVKGEFIGKANTNANQISPEFLFGYYYLPIFTVGSPPFSKTQFKAYPLSDEDVQIFGKGSGIGHERFRKSQLQEADGKCLRIFLTDYQLLDSYNGTVIENRSNVPRSENKCVVLKLKSA